MDDLRQPQGAAGTSGEKEQGAGEGEEQVFVGNEAQPIVVQGVDRQSRANHPKLPLLPGHQQARRSLQKLHLNQQKLGHAPRRGQKIQLQGEPFRNGDHRLQQDQQHGQGVHSLLQPLGHWPQLVRKHPEMDARRLGNLRCSRRRKICLRKCPHTRQRHQVLQVERH